MNFFVILLITRSHLVELEDEEWSLTPAFSVHICRCSKYRQWASWELFEMRPIAERWRCRETGQPALENKEDSFSMANRDTTFSISHLNWKIKESVILNSFFYKWQESLRQKGWPLLHLHLYTNLQKHQQTFWTIRFF